MKKNLVITAAFGFGIDQLELFIRSLRAHYKCYVFFVIGKNDKKLEI